MASTLASRPGAHPLRRSGSTARAAIGMMLAVLVNEAMGQYWLRDPACRGVHCAGPIITEVFNNAVSSGTSQGFDFKAIQIYNPTHTTVRLSDLQLIIYTPGRSETVEIRLSLAAAEFLPPAEYLLLCWGGNWLGTWYRNTDHEPCRALDACDDATMPAAGMSDTPAFLGLGHAINGDDVFELALTSGQTIDLIGPTQGCGPVVGVPISVCGEPLPLTGYRMIRNHTVITGDTEWPHAGSASGGQNSNGACEWTLTSVDLSNTASAWDTRQCPLDMYTSLFDNTTRGATAGVSVAPTPSPTDATTTATTRRPTSTMPSHSLTRAPSTTAPATAAPATTPSTPPPTSNPLPAPPPTTLALRPTTTVSPSSGQSGTGPGWYSGVGGASCDTACSAQGLVCTEQGLYDHNGEVNSSTEIFMLVLQHGGATSSSCDDNYTTASDVPNWADQGLCHMSGSRPLSSFNCSARPPQQQKRRLCYCLESDSGTSSSPPTSRASRDMPTQSPPTPDPTSVAASSGVTTLNLTTTTTATVTPPTSLPPPTATNGNNSQSADSAADDDGFPPWLIGIIAACGLAAIGLVYFCCGVRRKQGDRDRDKPPAHVHNPTYTDQLPHGQPQQQPYGVVSSLPSSTDTGGDGSTTNADIPATRSSRPLHVRLAESAYDAPTSPGSGAGLQPVIQPNYATLGGNRPDSGTVVYSAGPQSSYSARPQYAEATGVTHGANITTVASAYATVNKSSARDGRRSRSGSHGNGGGNDDNADAAGATGTGYENVAPSGFGDATTVDEGTAAIAPDYGSLHGAAAGRSPSAQGPGIYNRLGGSAVGAELDYAEVSPDDGLAAPVACAYWGPNGQACRTIALTGSRQCTRHTCNTRGCSKSKSSRVDFCGDHADSSA